MTDSLGDGTERGRLLTPPDDDDGVYGPDERKSVGPGKQAAGALSVLLALFRRGR